MTPKFLNVPSDTMEFVPRFHQPDGVFGDNILCAVLGAESPSSLLVSLNMVKEKFNGTV